VSELFGLGDVVCWGSNGSGQLGYPGVDQVGRSLAPSSAGPVVLDTDHHAIALAAGGYHTCALMENDDLRCWGSNGAGQLGLGHSFDLGIDTTPAAEDPIYLFGQEIVSFSLGEYHSCALLSTAGLHCWGDGSLGQLGLGGSQGNSTPPFQPIAMGGAVTGVGSGFSHTCAAIKDQGTRCWGLSDYGQLGYGNTEPVGVYQTPEEVGVVPLCECQPECSPCE